MTTPNNRPAELDDMERQPLPECHTTPVCPLPVDWESVPGGRWVFVNQKIREWRFDSDFDGEWVASFEWWNPSTRKWEPRLYRSRPIPKAEDEKLLVITYCHIELANSYTIRGSVIRPHTFVDHLRQWLRALLLPQADD